MLTAAQVEALESAGEDIANSIAEGFDDRAPDAGFLNATLDIESAHWLRVREAGRRAGISWVSVDDDGVSSDDVWDAVRRGYRAEVARRASDRRRYLEWLADLTGTTCEQTMARELGLRVNERGGLFSVSPGGVEQVEVVGSHRSLFGRSPVRNVTTTVYQVTSGGVTVLETADLGWAEDAAKLLTAGAERGLSTEEAMIEHCRAMFAAELQRQADQD